MNKVNDGSTVIPPRPLRSETAIVRFESILQPFVVLFSLLGLHIPISSSQGKVLLDLHLNTLGYGGCVWTVLLFGLLLLMINLAYYAYGSFVAMAVMANNGIGLNGANVTTITMISFGISWFNTAGYITLAHLCFFINVWCNQGDWKRLWINLTEIQLQMNLDEPFGRGCKRLVYFSLIFLFLETAYFFWPVSMCPMWLWNIDWLYPAYLGLLNLTNFIVRAIVALFFVLVTFAADFLAVMSRRAKTIVKKHGSAYGSNDSFLASELEKWRRHHLLICQFIRWINTCFGPVILLTITNGFISFITNFYNIFEALRNGDDIYWTFAAIFAHEVTQMFFFLYAPCNLKYKVRLSISNPMQ